MPANFECLELIIVLFDAHFAHVMEHLINILRVDFLLIFCSSFLSKLQTVASLLFCCCCIICECVCVGQVVVVVVDTNTSVI